MKMERREQTRYICAEAVEHLMGQGVQIVRQTMLKQEAIFKEQLRELHRLYDVQKVLMNEMRRDGLTGRPSSVMDRSLQLMTGTQVGSRAGGPVQDCSNGLSFEGSSEKLKLRNFQAACLENGDPKNSLDVFGKLLQDGGSRTSKRTFDLEKPPEEEMDDELNKEENNLREQRGDESKTQSYKDANTYCYPDGKIFLSLNTVSKDENRSMACASTLRSGFEYPEKQIALVLKRSRSTGERYIPSSDVTDLCTKPALSSHQNLIGALSIINLEKSSDQESLSSWNADDACSDGSRKKGRMSLNFDIEDSPEDVRKAQWESQGSLKSQAVFLNGVVSGQPSFMQEVRKSKGGSELPGQPEVHTTTFLEEKLAGQPRRKTLDAKEGDMQSSEGMHGYLKTTISSNSGNSQLRSNAASYGIHSRSVKSDHTRQPVSFYSWGESEPAASVLSAGLTTQGQGSTGRAGVSSDSPMRNGQTNLSHSMAAGVNATAGRSISQEGMTGLWFQPRPDLALFSQLHQHRALTGLQTPPVSSQMQVPWHTSSRVASNGSYSSPNGNFTVPKNSSLLECQLEHARKPTEDFSSNSWATASSGGPRFRTFGSVPSQKPSLNKPPKLVLDGDAMELKLASSNTVQSEKVVQSKVPNSALRGQQPQMLPSDEGMRDCSSHPPEQTTGSSRELAMGEALKTGETIGQHIYSPNELGKRATQQDCYNVGHVSNGSSNTKEQEITKEFGGEDKVSNSHGTKSGLDLELKPQSLVNCDANTNMAVSRACSDEGLTSNKALWAQHGANTFVKASASDVGAGLSLNLEPEKLQENLVVVEAEKSKFLNTSAAVDATANANRMTGVKIFSSHCEALLIERDTSSANTISPDEFANDANKASDCFEANDRLSADQNDGKAENSPKSTSHGSRHNELHENLPTNLGKEDKGAESLHLCPLRTTSEKKPLCAEEMQNGKVVVEQRRDVHSETPEGFEDVQASLRPAKSSSLNEQDANAPPIIGPESQPLKSSEGLEVAAPGEHIVASFGSTVTTAEEEISNPNNVEPNLGNGVSTQNSGSDRVSTGEHPHTTTGMTYSKSGCIDSLTLNHSSKALEVSEQLKALPELLECNRTTAVVSHCSTLTSAATPAGQQSSEASSHLHERGTHAIRKVPDEKICTHPKACLESQGPSLALMPTTEDTTEDGQSLCLDESANLAASILVSLLPNVSLPSNSSEKERCPSRAQKSSSSSADRLTNLEANLGKSGGSSSSKKSGPSPSLKLRYDPLRSKLQISSSKKVCTSERMKKDFSQRPQAIPNSTSLNVKGGEENASHEEPGSSNEGKSHSHKRRECDLASLNTQGGEDVIDRWHRPRSQEKLSSQKASMADTSKTKKLSRKSHLSKTSPGGHCTETPESKSGKSLDVGMCHKKDLVRNNSVTGCACYSTFEGEGSNQVVGQQAAKPNSLDNSEDEEMWGPLQTDSQPLDSEDETSKFPSEDPAVCIKSWGESTRKRRMQRHRNPAFHKRQKSHKISLSKLQS